MKMRKHLFFLLIIAMSLVSAVYLFRESLQTTLEKAFPSDYGKTVTETRKYKIDGKYIATATAKDVDIQAELTLNSALRNADWMTYEEAFCYDDLYVKNYKGTDKAIVGYNADKEKDKSEGNKDVEIDRGKYSRIQSVWLSEEVLAAAEFGGVADRLFLGENSYLDTMQVILGAGMKEKDVFTEGSSLTVRAENQQINAQVLGFLKPGATMRIGDKVVCLDFYVVCPLLDLSGLYDDEREAEQIPTSADPIYLPEAMVREDMETRDTSAERQSIEAGGKTYSPARCLWITDTDVDAMAEAPEWLTTLRNAKNEDGYSFMAGCNYEKKEIFSRGMNFAGQKMYGGEAKLICYGFIPEGGKLQILGKEYTLDDMIVIIMHGKTDKETTSGEEAASGGDDTSAEGTEKKEETGKTFETKERMRLFRLLVLKNSCFINTKMSADEAQRKLDRILEASWENYSKDNPDLERTSTYRIAEADPAGSVIYRDGIRKVPNKLKKVDAPGYYICILLLILYFLYKLWRGSEYYTTILMTGDTKIELILLFAVEAAILCAISCGVGYLLSFIVSKLLSLGSVPIGPIVSKNVRIVLFPLIAVGVAIGIRDFGKIFRRR